MRRGYREHLTQALGAEFDASAARRAGRRFIRAIVQRSFDMREYNYIDLACFDPRSVSEACDCLTEASVLLRCTRQSGRLSVSLGPAYMRTSRIRPIEVRASLDSRLKEEAVMTYFARPLAAVVTPWFYNHGWSANGVTALRGYCPWRR